MQWRFLIRLAAAVCIAAGGLMGMPAEAAKKKQAEPARPKEAWQLPMKVVVVRSSQPGCEPLCPEWISAEGEITTASPAQFRKALKVAGKKKLPVIINSPGGHMYAAIEIGRMIRKAKLDAAVGWTRFDNCAPRDKDCKLPKDQKGVYRGVAYSGRGFCNSACPLVLSGGVRRLSGMWSYVGVHVVRTTYVQERITYREKYRIVKGKKKVISRKEVSRKPYKTTQKDGIDKRLRKKLVAYYSEMGISTGILDDMLKAPYASIYQLSLNRQEELKLVTSRDTPDILTSNRACVTGAAAANCIESAGMNGTPQKVAALIPIPRQKPDFSKQDLQEAGTMSVAIVRSEVPGCEPLCAQWIAAEGEITETTPALFQLVLNAIGKQKLPLVLSSNGGDLEAALEIGRMVRKQGLDVVVAHSGYAVCEPESGDCQHKPRTVVPGRIINPGECKGTCVLVLAAGERRILPKSAMVVVRHPSDFRSRVSMQPAAAQIASYLAELGLSKELMKIMNGMGPGVDRLLLDFDLRQTQLMTEQVKIAGMDHPTVCQTTKPALTCVSR